MSGSSTFALDDLDDLADYSGEAQMSGHGSIEVHVPEIWTPEYVEHRLVAAFDVLKTTGDYGRPGGIKTAWKEYVLDYKEVQQRPARPSAFEIELSDEALQWPMRFMGEHPVLCDAILLHASSKSAGFDPGKVIANRIRDADPEANRRLQRRQAEARKAARDDVERWQAKQYKKRRIALDTPTEKLRRAMILINQGKARFDEAVQKIEAMKPDLLEIKPGKVMSVRALNRFKWEGFEMLAGRLIREGIIVR